jgi:hypothetical protein
MGKNRVLFSGGFSCAVVWFFHCQLLWNHPKLITKKGLGGLYVN